MESVILFKNLLKGGHLLGKEGGGGGGRIMKSMHLLA